MKTLYTSALLAAAATIGMTSTSANAAVASIPAGYSVIHAANYGVRCDGSKDNTAALKAAFNALKSYQVLQLPSGTCVYSNTIQLYKKSNAMVRGAGDQSTILKGVNATRTSLIVTQSSNFTLTGFQVYSPNGKTRNNESANRGIYVEKSNNVTLDSVRVNKVQGAGILFYVVTNSKIINSFVINSYADAFHVSGATKNVTLQNNYASGAGDDCFASVGYNQVYNYNINFINNQCYDNKASGITYEGTIGGKATGNKLVRTGVAAIRVASSIPYSTGKSTDIVVQGNTLDSVKTRSEVGHAAIMVFPGIESVNNIKFIDNKIINARTDYAARIMNDRPTKVSATNISFSNTVVTSSNGQTKYCVGKVASGVSGVSVSGTTLNSRSCNTIVTVR